MSAPPVHSILQLASQLVATRSCAGIDPPEGVLSVAEAWLEEHDLSPQLLSDGEGRPVALLVEIEGDAPGPLLCLDACIDTAPAGDPAQWSEQPFSGLVQGHRLLGRGSADSKSGVAILAHVARTFAATGLPRGTLHVLFDADEHTGRFGGARAYLEALSRLPDGVSLGYPGNEGIVVGGRGFFRARVHFFGKAAHSGEIERTGINAISKAAAFALEVEKAHFGETHDPAFAFGPTATVTHIEGGQGYSIVPDRAVCHLDIRLTRAFDAAQAQRWLEATAHEIDRGCDIEVVDHWPAYVVEPTNLLARSFAAAAEAAFGRAMPAEVSGMSNIGNLLAARGVPTICAPGVSFANIHAADEWADIDSIGPVYTMYCEAVRRFLAAG
ncbi:MAG: M20/M25/M40 family metallo-hydrolase [Alphaproteobacteria bacterium]|nr:M20/M25/M40 family metallo-hydrolase [Alphaproteobacteria bacterium]